MSRNVTVQAPRAQAPAPAGAPQHAEAGRATNGQHPRGAIACYWPPVDIVELDERIVVLADMPGLTAEDIEVTFEQGELTIRGTARPAARPTRGSQLLMEYAPADWFRSFRVGDTVDHTAITARYENGVLQLDLPKLEAAKPRRITVA